MPYNITYTHAVFRGWYDFGSGALGDMGHYSLYQIFRILNLDVPVSVEAGRSQFWKIDTGTWHKQVNMISYPRSSMIHFEFAARENMPPVDLYWYDGGMRPPKPVELDIDNKKMPEEGMMFVGDRGKILAGFTGTDPKIIPDAGMKEFTMPAQSLPRPIGELDQWLNACRGRKPSGARFEFAGKLSETVNLGNIALRVPDKLKWDKDGMQFTNSSDANKLIRRKVYRTGWEI